MSAPLTSGGSKVIKGHADRSGSCFQGGSAGFQAIALKCDENGCAYREQHRAKRMEPLKAERNGCSSLPTWGGLAEQSMAD